MRSSNVRRAFVLSSAVALTACTLPVWAQTDTSLPPPPTAAPTSEPATQASFNFDNAPIQTVLNYFSTTFGFTIVAETPVTGRISLLIQRGTIKADDALALLNTVLKTNGYAAVREG
ncbi:MAG TPA: hypothetical protein VL992_20275, partial [Tepidisphaeraceae bacterium]|nr:hypothetical protein [Tepidisphaeraceae bacterium]